MSYPVKPKLTIASNLPAVEDGSVVATTDTGELFIDANGVRTKLTDVIVGTYSGIINLIAPLRNKIYFATDTNQLLQASYGRGGTLTWKILNGYTLPTASQSVLGGVKVDGTTIVIENGVISAVGGGSGESSVDAGTKIVTDSGMTSLQAVKNLTPSFPGYVRGNASIDLQQKRNSNEQISSGSNSIAIGVYNTASYESAIAIGNNNSSTEYNCTAIGTGNQNNSQNGIVIGVSNECWGFYGIAIGAYNTITSVNGSSDSGGCVIGRSNTIIGSSDSCVIGNGITVSGDNIFAFGQGFGVVQNDVLAVNYNRDVNNRVYAHTGLCGKYFPTVYASESVPIFDCSSSTHGVLELHIVASQPYNDSWLGVFRIRLNQGGDYSVLLSDYDTSPLITFHRDNNHLYFYPNVMDLTEVQIGIRYTIVDHPQEHEEGYPGYDGYDGY